MISPAIRRLKSNPRADFTRPFLTHERHVSGVSFDALHERSFIPEVNRFNPPWAGYYAFAKVPRTFTHDWLAASLEADFWFGLGSVFWSDGTGRMGKGDGEFRVDGNVIAFKNASSVYHFPVGAQIVLIDQAAPVPVNGMPTPRAGTYLTVAARDEGAGTITLDRGLIEAFPTAENTDYIGLHTYFQTGDTYPSGIFRWVPFTQTEAATDWAGVTRSKDEVAYSGRRVHVPGTSSPDDVACAILEQYSDAGESSAQGDLVLFVPGHRRADWTTWARTSGCFAPDAGDRMHFVTYDGNGVVKLAWPGISTITVVFDPALHDPNVAQDEDQSCILLDMDNVVVVARGLAYEPPKTREDLAEFGGLVQFEVLDPSLCVVASTRADR